jgi:hypothetical protein
MAKANRRVLFSKRIQLKPRRSLCDTLVSWPSRDDRRKRLERRLRGKRGFD